MSPKKRETVECPNCGRPIVDNGKLSITCHYCGYEISRQEIEGGEADGYKEKMVIELTHNVNRFKFIRNIAFLVGAVSLISVLIIVLLINYSEYILIGLSMGLAIVWLGLGTTYSRKVENVRSKLFDIVGERDMIDDFI